MQSKTGKNSPRVGLVLNGGVARSVFQIGILEELQKYCSPEIVVGTGWGTFFGAAMIRKIPMDIVRDVVSSLRPKDFALGNKSPLGLFDPQPLLDRLLPLIGISDFWEYSRGFLSLGCDIEKNQAVELTDGDVEDVIRVGFSLPGFQPPVGIGGRFVVDGTIFDPLPIYLAKKRGVEKIIAIDTVSQHQRSFYRDQSRLSPWEEAAWHSMPHIWVLRKRDIPRMQIRVIEESLTSAVDLGLDKYKPDLMIKLEDWDLGKEVMIDSFDLIPDLLTEGKKAGARLRNKFEKVLS